LSKTSVGLPDAVVAVTTGTLVQIHQRHIAVVGSGLRALRQHHANMAPAGRAGDTAQPEATVVVVGAA
jgi:hypothetical protein